MCLYRRHGFSLPQLKIHSSESSKIGSWTKQKNVNWSKRFHSRAEACGFVPPPLTRPYSAWSLELLSVKSRLLRLWCGQPFVGTAAAPPTARRLLVRWNAYEMLHKIWRLFLARIFILTTRQRHWPRDWIVYSRRCSKQFRMKRNCKFVLRLYLKNSSKRNMGTTYYFSPKWLPMKSPSGVFTLEQWFLNRVRSNP